MMDPPYPVRDSPRATLRSARSPSAYSFDKRSRGAGRPDDDQPSFPLTVNPVASDLLMLSRQRAAPRWKTPFLLVGVADFESVASAV
jgi:hypothetical protein